MKTTYVFRDGKLIEKPKPPPAVEFKPVQWSEDTLLFLEYCRRLDRSLIYGEWPCPD